MKGPRNIVPMEDFVAHGLAPLAGAPLPHLTNHGGPVLPNVEVVPIYWGAAWANATNAPLTNQLDAFFDFILTSTHMDMLREYGIPGSPIGHGRRLASARITNSEPGTLVGGVRQVTDVQVQQGVQGFIANRTVPARTANTLYFVYLPPNAVSVGGDGSKSCVQFCGYHGAVGGVYYAVIPYANCNGCVFAGNFIDTLTEVSSHELVEAITDPALNAWWDSSSGNEIGDICNRQTVRLGGFLIQTEWSNAQGACVIAPQFPSSVSDPVAYTFANPAGTVFEQHNLFRSADGHIHALWFNFGRGWHLEDRTTLVPGVPAAVAGPFGYAFVKRDGSIVEQHNLFRAADGHIHALWFNFATGWHHEDRTLVRPGVPAAVGKPFGYSFVKPDGSTFEQHNLFRSADGHIHALWFNFATGWHHEDRSSLLPHVPAAVGDPIAYTFVSPNGQVFEQHNLFRSGDGHIHAFWFNFASGWHHEDRTTLRPGIPPAVGDPSAYAFVNPAGNVLEQHNLFRSADGHIHALWFNFASGWHHEDRSMLRPGIPPAVGNPFGYTFISPNGQVVEQHNLFRSADGHIHALWFNFASGWHHEDRSLLVPGVPPAVGDPFGYTYISADGHTVEQHNLFRTADGHIHALWFNFATGWHHEDRRA